MGDERIEAMNRITAKGNTLRQFNQEGIEVFFSGIPVEVREQLRAFQPPSTGEHG